MKRSILAVALLWLILPSTSGAVDIYLLQYGYEQGIACPGSGSGNYFTTQYCSKPPTFEVFDNLDAAKKRLQESSPVAAFKVQCWSFGGGKPSCFATEMEIVVAKDLKEKAAAAGLLSWTTDSSRTITVDNTITIIDPNGRRP